MPSGALDAISDHFGVTNKTHLVLLNSLYMIGYIIGPLIFGPLSEKIGRQPVMIGTFLGYLIFMLACSGAPTYGALLAFRTLGGLNAAAPNVVLAGLYSDVLEDPSIRGNAMSLYMFITNVGALTGPAISGFSSTLSWRWPFWIASMVAAVGSPFVLTLPETFAPVLQLRYEEQCRKEGDMVQAEKVASQGAKPVSLDAKKIFLRPFKMLVTEPALLSTSAYITLAYAVFYLMFQAYPIIFQGKHPDAPNQSFRFVLTLCAGFYGLSPGLAGLALMPGMYEIPWRSVGKLLTLGDSSPWHFCWFRHLRCLQPSIRTEAQSRSLVGSERSLPQITSCMPRLALVCQKHHCHCRRGPS